MKEYEKIETIYARDTEGTKKLIFGEFRDKTVEFLRHINWVWTEKINGTNIRVNWDGHTIVWAGRTDKADIPKHLDDKLESLFGSNETEEMFEQLFGGKKVTIYGEGYGCKINNGGNYILDKKTNQDCDFIVFDIEIDGVYLERKNVEAISKSLGLRVVPIVGIGPLTEAVRYVKEHHNSQLSYLQEMEGIVCRPEIELRDRLGKRIIVKIKWEDFK